MSGAGFGKEKYLQIGGIFLLLLTLFPPFFERLFSNENKIDSLSFHILSWLFFCTVAAYLLLLLFSKKTLNSSFKKGLGFFSSAWFMFLLLLFADRIYGRISNALHSEIACGSLYPVNSKVHYKSFEMDFMLETNAYGFRANQKYEKQKKKKRIACIGDSFTLGWGVEQEQSWPSLLQKRVNTNGLESEVLNWGKGGHQPQDYLSVAREMIPQWQPDFLVLSFLQFEDLFQLALSQDLIKNKSSQKGNSLVSQLAFRLFPNIWERMQTVNLDEKIDPQWQAQAAKIKKSWSKETLQYFEALPDSVQQYFLAGELNPWMLDMNLRYPNWTDSLFNPSFELEKLADIFAANLQEIDSLANAYQTRVFYSSVPLRAELNQHEKYKMQAVGIDFNREKADEFLRNWQRLLAKRGISVFENSACMAAISAQSSQSLFYDLDGHFNAKGNLAYLNCVYPEIENFILEKTN